MGKQGGGNNQEPKRFNILRPIQEANETPDHFKARQQAFRQEQKRAMKEHLGKDPNEVKEPVIKQRQGESIEAFTERSNIYKQSVDIGKDMRQGNEQFKATHGESVWQADLTSKKYQNLPKVPMPNFEKPALDREQPPAGIKLSEAQKTELAEKRPIETQRQTPATPDKPLTKQAEQTPLRPISQNMNAPRYDSNALRPKHMSQGQENAGPNQQQRINPPAMTKPAPPQGPKPVGTKLPGPGEFGDNFKKNSTSETPAKQNSGFSPSNGPNVKPTGRGGPSVG